MSERTRPQKIRCDACPVMCFIAEGKIGACDRYANLDGKIIRCDPLTMLDKRLEQGGEITPFLKEDWDGSLVNDGDVFVTAVGAGTTYPDYKPAPFIVSRQYDDADFVTVVSEAIFSYCSCKIKIDTDRHLGAEAAIIRVKDEIVGHVMTSEYGSQMLSLGGVDHLTGGSKTEGRVTCDTLLRLFNREAVELNIEGGVDVIVQSGKAPIVNGVAEARMRVGCGSAAIGMFAAGWQGLVDEVVVIDDHITGVVSEHQAGKVIDWPTTGIKIIGRRSTPGRYFQVAQPGMGWGGTDIEDPLSILGAWNAKKGAYAGLSMLMVSTTGENAAYFVLDDHLIALELPMPDALQATVDLIAENCEPALCSVMFMGGAGGSLRSGVTANPVKLTRSVQAFKTTVTCGGQKAYVWPGGGITIMVDVKDMPEGSFGYVPTPAIVAPLEFTVLRSEYKALGGHDDAIRDLRDVLEHGGEYGADMRAVAPKGGA